MRLSSHSLAVLVRILLQVVIFFLLLATVVGLGSSATGLAEKAAMVLVGALLVWAAVGVARIGRHHVPGGPRRA